MMDLGYDEAARVCMTHSFNNGKIEEYIGRFDTGKADTDLIIAYLSETCFDDYDRLIQLCDALAGSSAILDVEARMNDVKSRYGYYPEDKWNRNLKLLAYFSEGCGMDVYKVVCKDSFRLPY